MSAYRMIKNGEPIYLGDPGELAAELDRLPHYGAWTDQCGHWMLAKACPGPSYVEKTRRDLEQAAQRKRTQ